MFHHTNETWYDLFITHYKIVHHKKLCLPGHTVAAHHELNGERFLNASKTTWSRTISQNNCLATDQTIIYTIIFCNNSPKTPCITWVTTREKGLFHIFWGLILAWPDYLWMFLKTDWRKCEFIHSRKQYRLSDRNHIRMVSVFSFRLQGPYGDVWTH